MRWSHWIFLKCPRGGWKHKIILLSFFDDKIITCAVVYYIDAGFCGLAHLKIPRKNLWIFIIISTADNKDQIV